MAQCGEKDRGKDGVEYKGRRNGENGHMCRWWEIRQQREGGRKKGIYKLFRVYRVL